MEALFSLRTLLLLIGAAIVAAIYVLGSRASRRNRRIRYEQQRPRTFEPRRRKSPQATAPAFSPDTGVDDVSPAVPVDDVVVRTDEPIELPAITRGGDEPARARFEDNQMELTFDEASAAAARSDAASPSIIALYIRPPAGREFAGTAIVAAMNAVGLRFGDMKIFHHYGAGELTTDTPLFSVANLVEPGHFDLANIDRFSTPGLAMFLQLPGPLDGAVAFELFLNTAQRLAEALDGDLYGAPERLLDGITIDEMRHEASPFAHVV